MNSIESADQTYSLYKFHLQKIADVKYTAAVLQWDQETYLPSKGSDGRARQLATLNEIAHEMFITDKTGELLRELLSQALSPKQKRNAELTFEDYSRAKKLSPEFVRKMSETVSASFHAWIEARKQNDFAVFETKLRPLVELKKQEADMLGYKGHPYNVLMDEFEKGATTTMIDKVFADVTPPLMALLAEVKNQPVADDGFLHQHFDKHKQWEWSLYIAEQLGFDFGAGRQDISEHPFTTNFSSRDVRITTRINEDSFGSMTWSTIHETGHGLYEQGLPADQYGLPLGEYASLSIHESQSRLWENCVGRGSAFWNYFYPKLQEFFPQQFNDISPKQFINAINKVQPSLVRTEADELTYHFHVMIRYEIEKKLIESSLLTKDIAAYWNEAYEKYLGVRPVDDNNGSLQDVHWSHGSFGYFPTYSLGSFYAAQFWKQANKELPDLQSNIQTTGNTASLLTWLREKIHAHGRYYNSNELCINITGAPLDSTVFVDYLRKKLMNS